MSIKFKLLLSATILSTQGAQAFAQDRGASLDEVVVTASRVAQPIQQLGDSVSVLSAEQIALEQLTTLDEALERVPGVAITRSGGVGQNTQVRMRGFTTKHVLTMIDGVKISNPSEADNQFGIDHLFLDNVERVEVLRGPQSGLYGADAVAGVINIITKRPQGPLSGRASVMTGSHDTYEVAVSGQGGNDVFGLQGGVTYFDTEGISLASRAPGNQEEDGYENFTLQARGEWTPTDTLSLTAWARYIDAENEIDAGFLPADNPQGLPGFLFQDSPGFTDNQQFFGAVTGRLETLDGRLTHDVQVSLVDLESTYVAPGTEQDSEGRTTEAQYYATYSFTDSSFILAGAEYRDEYGRFEQPEGFAFALVDDSISNAAIFTDLNWELAEGFYLSGAVRYDDNERFGGETTYRATAAYNMPQNFDLSGVDTKLRASYGTGAEAPGLRQLLGSSATFQGNPDLQPESSWMWDAGFDQSLESGHARWSLTYYMGEADDGIFNIFNPDTGVSSPQNVSSPVEMHGVEADVIFNPVPWLQGRAAYTHNIVELENSSTQLFGRPKHELSGAVTVFPIERLSLTLDAYWRSEFFSDYPSSFEMDSYALFNLSAAYDLNDNLRVSAKLHNVADEDYEEKLGDSTYGRTAQIRLTATY